MKADPDATRLLALLAAICGPEINIYQSKIEALVATRKANARLTGEAPNRRPPSTEDEQ
jgi:hypothetical protein